jgi:hypothetical protein
MPRGVYDRSKRAQGNDASANGLPTLKEPETETPNSVLPDDEDEDEDDDLEDDDEEGSPKKPSGIPAQIPEPVGAGTSTITHFEELRIALSSLFDQAMPSEPEQLIRAVRTQCNELYRETRDLRNQVEILENRIEELLKDKATLRDAVVGQAIMLTGMIARTKPRT